MQCCCNRELYYRRVEIENLVKFCVLAAFFWVGALKKSIIRNIVAHQLPVLILFSIRLPAIKITDIIKHILANVLNKGCVENIFSKKIADVPKNNTITNNNLKIILTTDIKLLSPTYQLVAGIVAFLTSFFTGATGVFI
jgi:hypothetical protein